METKLEATEMWFKWRMLRIRWKEPANNTGVLKIRRSKFVFTIIKRQMKFLEHLRNRNLENVIFTGHTEGKRRNGEQRAI